MKNYKRFFLILLLIVAFKDPSFGQEADTLGSPENIMPEIDLEAIADTIIYEQDTLFTGGDLMIPEEESPEETLSAPTTPFTIIDLDVYNFSFSGISWHLSKDRVEWLLEANEFVKQSDDVWVTLAGEDSLICYPDYQSDLLYGFHVDYFPENRSDSNILDRYKKIVRILTEKYGNPGKVTVLETRRYVPEWKFYTHAWTKGKESLTTSINRAEKKIELIFSVEADSITIRKNELDKRLYELF